MLSRSFFPNFGQGPFPKTAGKGPAITNNLMWDKHIQNITNKGSRTFRLHKKEPPRIHSPGESGYLQMYKAMVRPSHEYALTVRDPPSQAHISTVHIHVINCGLKSVRLTKNLSEIWQNSVRFSQKLLWSSPIKPKNFYSNVRSLW